MGTNVYGSYDQLVIELGGLDRWKAGRREVRIALDDVWSVRAADPRDLVTFAGERVLRVGRRNGGAPVLVLATPEAADLAEGLRRSGVGVHDRPLAAAR
jgi:hypothetical protein